MPVDIDLTRKSMRPYYQPDISKARWRTLLHFEVS